MDLAELKNIDLKEIFSKLKSGGLSDKKAVSYTHLRAHET